MGFVILGEPPQLWFTHYIIMHPIIQSKSRGRKTKIVKIAIKLIALIGPNIEPMRNFWWNSDKVILHESWRVGHWKHLWNTLKLSSIFETCTYVRAMHMPWLCLSLTTVVSVMRVSPEEATEQCHIESLNHNGHICRPFFNKIRLKWCWWCAIPCKLTFMSKKIIWLHQQWNKENFPTPLSWCLFITDDFPSQAFPHSWNASRGPEMILHKSPHVPFRQN